MKKAVLKKGFTLIELIVVIAIIGVLAAMIIPSLLGYVRKARRTADLSAAKTISKEANSVFFFDSDVSQAFSVNNVSNLQTVTDSDGNTYNIAAIAQIGGKNSSSVNKQKWVPFETQGEVFCNKINMSMVLGNSDLNIPMKYDPDSPAGKSLNADTWAICYRTDSGGLEIWVGDSHGAGSFEAMYCVYPYISDGY